MNQPTKYYLVAERHQLVIHAESLLDAIRKWGSHVARTQQAFPLNVESLRVHHGRRSEGVNVKMTLVVKAMNPTVWQFVQLAILDQQGEQELERFCTKMGRQYNLGKTE